MFSRVSKSSSISSIFKLKGGFFIPSAVTSFISLKSPFIYPSRLYSSSSYPSPSLTENGVKTDKNLMISFKCNKCEERTTRFISRKGYDEGLVIVKCDGCSALHLISDKIGWFKEKSIDPDFDLEKALAEKGELVITGKMKSQ